MFFRHALSKHKGLDPTGKAVCWGDEVSCFETSSPEPSWLQNWRWEFTGSRAGFFWLSLGSKETEIPEEKKCPSPSEAPVIVPFQTVFHLSLQWKALASAVFCFFAACALEGASQDSVG